jgi:hypothetical protein
MALDWCSGAEIVGKKRRGLLIRPLEYTSVSTWGNALDKFPDVNHVVSELQRMHDHPHERAAIAQRGMTWARAQTWTAAVDAVAAAIERVRAGRAALAKAG